MKIRVIVFLLFIMFTTAFFAFSQQSADDDEWYLGIPIRDIIFTGLKNISASELDGVVEPFKRRIFDYSVFWELQGRLYALEYFDQIEPSLRRANASGSELVIVFNVVERPVIERINFIGISGATRRELSQVIISRVGEVFNQAKLSVDVDAITNRYIELGYPNVAVTAQDVQTSDLGITLNFHITENDRITISRIEFQGNSRYSNNILRSQMSLRPRSILNSGAFQEAALLADIEAITKYYRDRGYIDAIIRDVTRTFEEGNRGTSLVLTFMIDEGNEYRFGGVTFDGNVIFSTDQLSRLITVSPGSIVNMTRLEIDLQKISDLYFENGYIFNSIVRNPEKNTQAQIFSVNVTIVERGRAYIENIIIIGNNKTRDNVILREIELEPGDVFSRTKIMDAMRNLFNLQYFSMVMPDTLQGSTENLMDLVLTFEEQPTTDIQFGLSFSGSADPNTFPVSGLLKWTDRNLAGTGNEFGVEINSTVIDSSSFAANYIHRWLLGLPLSLGVSFAANFSRHTDYMNNSAPFFHGNEPYAYPDGFTSFEDFEKSRTLSNEYLMSYQRWFLSLAFSTGYRWPTPFGIFGTSGGLRFGVINNYWDEMEFRPFDPVLRESNNVWRPRNILWLSLSLDQRDIFFDPSRGYLLSQRFGFHGIFPEEREHYIRSDTRTQFFHTVFNIPVTERWNFKAVLGVQLAMSLILEQPGREISIERVNQLAIDGMFIGRGWSEEFRNRGYLLFDNWVELRIPLLRGLLAWDFFFDAVAIESERGYYFGTNSSGESNFTLENFRFGLGGGLRFTIPQFPIRLSLVKRFRIEDDTVQWQPGPLFWGMDFVMAFAMSY